MRRFHLPAIERGQPPPLFFAHLFASAPFPVYRLRFRCCASGPFPARWIRDERNVGSWRRQGHRVLCGSVDFCEKSEKYLRLVDGEKGSVGKVHLHRRSNLRSTVCREVFRETVIVLTNRLSNNERGGTFFTRIYVFLSLWWHTGISS